MTFTVVSSTKHAWSMLNRLAQSVTCLTVDPGVTSSIPALFHTFVENDHESFQCPNHEIIFMAILLPSAYSRTVVVSYNQNYVQEVLVNLVKIAQEKSVVR